MQNADRNILSELTPTFCSSAGHACRFQSYFLLSKAETSFAILRLKNVSQPPFLGRRRKMKELSYEFGVGIFFLQLFESQTA